MTLLFDFGGVLVDLNKQRCIDNFAAMGLDVKPYLGAFFQNGPFSLLEQGRLSIPEFCAALRKMGNNPAVTDEMIVSAWKSFLVGIPVERLELLKKIKQHYSVNLLSNTNWIHWQQAVDELFPKTDLSVNDLFDQVFLSCELGIEKPAPELYAKVVEAMGVPAGEILFFDDSEVNCESARRCGLQALLAPAGSEWFKYFDENGKLQLS